MQMNLQDGQQGVWCGKCYGDHYTNDCPVVEGVTCKHDKGFEYLDPGPLSDDVVLKVCKKCRKDVFGVGMPTREVMEPKFGDNPEIDVDNVEPCAMCGSGWVLDFKEKCPSHFCEKLNAVLTVGWSTVKPKAMSPLPEGVRGDYWNQTETAKLCDAAQAALFAVSQHMEKVLKREDWNEAHGLRVKLGGLEHRMRFTWDRERQQRLESEAVNE
jgi:hypothetical protein